MEETVIRGYSLGFRRRSHNGYERKPLAGLGGPVQDWEQQAACQDTPIEWWFGTDSVDHRPFRYKFQTAMAKSVCGSCPVMIECRSWALEYRIEHGIYGGLTESERRQV
jgi:WhiB family redox-sensing transcriptional regulator